MERNQWILILAIIVVASLSSRIRRLEAPAPSSLPALSASLTRKTAHRPAPIFRRCPRPSLQVALGLVVERELTDISQGDVWLQLPKHRAPSPQMLLAAARTSHRFRDGWRRPDFERGPTLLIDGVNWTSKTDLSVLVTVSICVVEEKLHWDGKGWRWRGQRLRSIE
jgi:hypothetical protein